jgi:RNA-binding protein
VALTGKQRRHLRALGHALRPVVQVGREGVGPQLVGACHKALDDHELIKVKLGSAAEGGRDEIATALAAATGAELAQILGRTILLYRRRPTEDERPRIQLPG